MNKERREQMKTAVTTFEEKLNRRWKVSNTVGKTINITHSKIQNIEFRSIFLFSPKFQVDTLWI